MSEKLRYYEEMSVQTARQIAAGYDEWRSFLDTSARLYKYGYEDQLLIHAQRPDATACASYELWNERMRRYVKRGTTGIALIDRSGDKPKLNYVFDVSDTGTRHNSRTPQAWTMDEQSQNVVSEMLRQRYDASDLPGLPVQLYTIAASQADAYWQEHRQDVLDIIDGSFLCAAARTRLLRSIRAGILHAAGDSGAGGTGMARDVYRQIWTADDSRY